MTPGRAGGVVSPQPSDNDAVSGQRVWRTVTGRHGPPAFRGWGGRVIGLP
jgi:hypothetical protein